MNGTAYAIGEYANFELGSKVLKVDEEHVFFIDRAEQKWHEAALSEPTTDTTRPLRRRPEASAPRTLASALSRGPSVATCFPVTPTIKP